ncbi:MAG: hypothetical protein BRC33_07270 [Cyanobacteria bacterium SW_9_44_58]|nr:MAG: hypothetical protein BRC33_07270 [Cyanobacteria bacterium SW_9_44_58]
MGFEFQIQDDKTRDHHIYSFSKLELAKVKGSLYKFSVIHEFIPTMGIILSQIHNISDSKISINP